MAQLGRIVLTHIGQCVGRQESGVRGQGSEVRGQRSEVRGQRSEVRGQRSEVRGQRSEVRGNSLSANYVAVVLSRKRVFRDIIPSLWELRSAGFQYSFVHTRLTSMRTDVRFCREFCRVAILSRSFVAKLDFWRHNCQLTQSRKEAIAASRPRRVARALTVSGGCRAKEGVASCQRSGSYTLLDNAAARDGRCTGDRRAAHDIACTRVPIRY
jgi:hypothetical protein